MATINCPVNTLYTKPRIECRGLVHSLLGEVLAPRGRKSVEDDLGPGNVDKLFCQKFANCAFLGFLFTHCGSCSQIPQYPRPPRGGSLPSPLVPLMPVLVGNCLPVLLEIVSLCRGQERPGGLTWTLSTVGVRTSLASLGNSTVVSETS